MMQSMMDCGGWLMMGMVILLTLVLALGAAALIKYLFFGRRSGERNERHNVNDRSRVPGEGGDLLALA
jgi:hypothetical protein